MCNILVDIYGIGYIKPSWVRITEKIIVIILLSISSYHIDLCKTVCASIIILFSNVNILYYLHTCAHTHIYSFLDADVCDKFHVDRYLHVLAKSFTTS